MPLVVEIMLGAVALPAVLSAIFLLIAWRPWDGDKTATRAGFWGGAVGLAAGYVAAHIFVAGLPDVVPSDDVDWMVHMAALAGLFGAFEAKVYRSRIGTLIGRLVVIVATFWLTLGFMVEHHWEETSGLLAIGVLSIVTLEAIIILDKAAERRRGALVPLAMTILAAGAAVTLGLIGTARIAQLMGGLAAASGAFVVLTWWRPLVRASRGPVTVFGVLYGGLLAAGYFNTQDFPGWAEVLDHYPTLAVLILATAPLTILIADSEILDRFTGWKRTLIGVMFVALPVAGAVYAPTIEVEEENESEELDDVDYEGLYE